MQRTRSGIRICTRTIVSMTIMGAIATLILVACSQGQTEYVLVFQHSAGNGVQIYAVDADGSDLRCLTEFSGPLHWSWLSPDGRRLAALSYPRTLRIVELSTGEVIDHLEMGQFRREDILIPETVAWSPDGTALAFLRDRLGYGTGTDISIYDLTTQQVNALTDDGAIERSPAWSANGEWIAFAIQRGVGESSWSIAAIHPDGTGLHTIVDMGDTGTQLGVHQPWLSLCNLTWSPNNTYIAFEDGCDPFWPTWYKEIFVAATDGSGMIQASNLRGERMGISELSYSTQWAPSGDRLFIAYSQAPWGPPHPDQVKQMGILTVDMDPVTITDIPGPTSMAVGTLSLSGGGRFVASWEWNGDIVGLAEFTGTQINTLDIPSESLEGVCSQLQWEPNNLYIAYTTEGIDSSCFGSQGIGILPLQSGQEVDVTASLGGDNRIIGWIPAEALRP